MGIMKQKILEELHEAAEIEEAAENAFYDSIADEEPEEDFDEEEAMIQAAEEAFEEAQIDKEIARQEKIQALVQEKLANFSAGDMPGWRE
tara:strand:- start:162 stop:431 length:270 start_codon:yes stop_codon:yes gene_type:complete